MSKSFFTALFRFDRFHRFALIRFTFCIGSLDFVVVKEVNISTLDIVIAILIRLCNSTLLYYICKYPKINMHFLHTVLDIFPMDLTMKIC